MSPAVDRNVLLGLLGLRLGFLDQDQLVAALTDWVRDKDRALGDVLVARGLVSPEHRALLDRVAEVHVAHHGGEPRSSLKALGAADLVVVPTRYPDDPELESSLRPLAGIVLPEPDHEPHAARLPLDDHIGTVSTLSHRYRLLRMHAKGGLGQVWIALDTELDRPVALKELGDERAYDLQSRARFIREAEITGKLEHPGIVPVYGLGHDRLGRPFYAMRFVQGERLAVAIARYHEDSNLRHDPARRLLVLRSMLERFVFICSTIAYAHSRGVLHRDLKPDNVMLGPYGQTLVLDWGLARSIEPEQDDGAAGDTASEPVRPSRRPNGGTTQSGLAVGTPAFMSPEQAAGRNADLGSATDVYGLGAILYTILTSRPPADEPDLERTLDAAVRGAIRRPRSLAAGVPRDLEAICLKALAHRPGDRYASADALGEDVSRWLADEAVTAVRDSFLRRCWRWLRRP